MANTEAPAIELRAISKRFGGAPVLDQVCLSVAPGEIFALLGASGSGKSTLLRIVAGIEQPDSGEVWLNGAAVTDRPPHRRRVHTVFQNYALFPHLNVAANVAFPLAVAGVAKRDQARLVDRALGWVRMETLRDRRVQNLSGGERQRVALARALVDDSPCVLLDEPLAALDPHLRSQTLELLQDVQARLQVTYLYVTHDRSEALRAAHRIGVLRNGRLEQVGTPEEIYSRPLTPFVASFIGPINWLNGVVAGDQGAVALRLPDGRRVPIEPVSQQPGDSVQLGIRPEQMRIGEPGFIRATVVQRQFSGSVVSLKLQIAPELFVTAELNHAELAPHAGEIVPIFWPTQSAVAYDGELAR